MSNRNKMEVNTIRPFDGSILAASVNLRQLEECSTHYVSRGSVTGLNRLAWALKALSLTDLTTLAGDDTASNVSRLCHRAVYPLPLSILDDYIDPGLHKSIHTAAVCVYPARVGDAFTALKQLNSAKYVSIASVATGFPTGQYNLLSRLEEIKFAIEAGAREIDIVINRQLALVGDWEGVYREVCAMRNACGSKALLKTILAIGELGTMENVYKASMVCMMAGADFIKTSTGKEAVNATIPVGLAMIYAIEAFHSKTGIRVGLKPAGGVRTVDEAISWLKLILETLGSAWLCPRYFRFGASGLLDDIEKVIREGLSKNRIDFNTDTAY